MSRSVADLLSSGDVTPKVLSLLLHPLVERLIAERDAGTASHVSASSILLDDELGQIERVSDGEGDAATDETLVREYGSVLVEIASACRKRRLLKIARKCASGQFATLEDVHLAVERYVSNTIYLPLLAIIAALLALLWAMNRCQTTV